MWILMIAWLGLRSFILNFLLKTQTEFVQWVSSCSDMWQNNATFSFPNGLFWCHYCQNVQVFFLQYRSYISVNFDNIIYNTINNNPTESSWHYLTIIIQTAKLPHRTVLLVLVVEDNGHTGFRHAGLPLLVYKLWQISNADLRKIGDAKNKANGVQDVRLSATIQTWLRRCTKRCITSGIQLHGVLRLHQTWDKCEDITPSYELVINQLQHSK